MNNWIGLIVKHVWNNAMQALHIYFGFDINTKAFCLGQYLILKRSMLRPLLFISKDHLNLIVAMCSSHSECLTNKTCIRDHFERFDRSSDIFQKKPSKVEVNNIKNNQNIKIIFVPTIENKCSSNDQRLNLRYSEAVPLLETIFNVREKLLTVANVHVVLVLCELVSPFFASIYCRYFK